MDEDTQELYVYHRVPPNLRGSVLYPLNHLEDIFPDLYVELRKNYATREDIASLRIPPLGNCLWNDVLHFSPVHPSRLKAALAEADHELPAAWRRFFQVDARLLDKDETTIYQLLQAFYSGEFNIGAASEQIGRECLPFEPDLLQKFSEIPSATRAYYSSTAPGSPVMLYLHVPHVLYRGRLDLSQDGISVIEV